jgi:hypothetical protein
MAAYPYQCRAPPAAMELTVHPPLKPYPRRGRRLKTPVGHSHDA